MAGHDDNHIPGHGDHHHGHLSEIPDVSYIKNVDVTHEASDVSVEAIGKFIVALTIMTAVTFGLMWLVFNVLNRQVTKKDLSAAPGPMARTEQERLPPEPRLQAARGFGIKLESGKVVNLDSVTVPGQPQAEYRVLRQQWEETLQKGKSDASGKPVAIPISEAMKKILENAPPTRPQTGSADPAIQLPTSASSGRVTTRMQ
jgi:hypothetical protein